MQLSKEDELKAAIAFCKGENIRLPNSKNVVQADKKKNVQQGSAKDHVKIFNDIRKNFLGQDS